MKNTILLLFTTMIFNLGFAQGGPKIEFSALENTIDYGKVIKGTDNGIRNFDFRNTGDSPLIITDVFSTCGCVVISKPTQPIMPGKSSKIEIKYNMAIGPIRKTLTVESNAVNYDSGRVALKIKGEVFEK